MTTRCSRSGQTESPANLPSAGLPRTDSKEADCHQSTSAHSLPSMSRGIEQEREPGRSRAAPMRRAMAALLSELAESHGLVIPDAIRETVLHASRDKPRQAAPGEGRTIETKGGPIYVVDDGR